MKRIAVFYDGTYLYKASNYFLYNHEIARRISISGVHDYVKNFIAEKEHERINDCQIVESHYFRGRAIGNVSDDEMRGDRKFDEVLMKCGVTCHYLPMINGHEKGIDVCLSLEAFELAFLKKFDIAVLITGDGDYVPLLRKLNSLGIKVMIISFEYKVDSDEDNKRTIKSKTSKQLIYDSSYYVEVVESLEQDDTEIDKIFV